MCASLCNTILLWDSRCSTIDANIADSVHRLCQLEAACGTPTGCVELVYINPGCAACAATLGCDVEPRCGSSESTGTGKCPQCHPSAAAARCRSHKDTQEGIFGAMAVAARKLGYNGLMLLNTNRSHDGTINWACSSPAKPR